MAYLSPQLADDLILGSVKRRGGQTINDPSRLVAAHSLQQMQDTNATDEAGRNLGLQRSRLDQSQNQFNVNLGLAQNQSDTNNQLIRRQLRYGRRAGNTAAAISGLGLGVSTLGNIQANKLNQERLAAKNELIKKYQSIGDADSLFYANMLKYMR